MTNNRSSTSTSPATPIMMMPVPSGHQQHPPQHSAPPMMMVPVMPMAGPFHQAPGTDHSAAVASPNMMMPQVLMTPNQQAAQPMMMVPVQPIVPPHPMMSSAPNTSGALPQALAMAPQTPSPFTASAPAIMSTTPNPSSSPILVRSDHSPSASQNNCDSRKVYSGAHTTTPTAGSGAAHFKALRESAALIDVSDQEKDNGPKQLIINFISLETTEEDLTELFSPIGALDAVRVIVDRNNKNRSKGYAFVYFVSSGDAVKAIKKLQGSLLKGKHIKVGFAIPQRPSPVQLARQAMLLSEEHQSQNKQHQHSQIGSVGAAVPRPISTPAPQPALMSNANHQQPAVLRPVQLPPQQAMMLVPVPSPAPAMVPVNPISTTSASHNSNGGSWTTLAGSSNNSSTGSEH